MPRAPLAGLLAFACCLAAPTGGTVRLGAAPPAAPVSPGDDWLVSSVPRPARVVRRDAQHEIELVNGLVRRTWRVSPAVATVALDNLATGQSLVRGVKPEALVTLDGQQYAVGGLLGQPDYAYLRPPWLDRMTADPGAFRLKRAEDRRLVAPFAWKRTRPAPDTPWPPPGAGLAFTFESPDGVLPGVFVVVHYELYDGLPLFAKWLEVRNDGPRPVTVDRFVSEVLAVVEHESEVEAPGTAGNPLLQVDSDYSFIAVRDGTANTVAHWVPDPQYTTQVNYRLQAPVLLEVRPPLGPAAVVPPGGRFETFRAYELVHDSTERERRGLATRRMYRTLAPWAAENPLFMHVRSAAPDAVRLAIDQAADVGFEMVILTFGSGFDFESTEPATLAATKALVDYARGKGIELGAYSLLASRSAGADDDVINPKTGTTGGAIFGNSPCLGSRWGERYFAALRQVIEATGLSVLEHDGSYPGDACASMSHPGHRGLDDSQWTQWRTIAGFYQWCRARGVYLNVPDWYFLAGANKSAMGYREVNWSLPRDRQIVLARQNIFDGTWDKTPSMGWMFVPLVEYHGGGADATLEPLSEHLDAYGQHLAQNLLAGVQAAYRGPRLYDTPATRAVVKRWVDIYKAHRDILESDVVHVRRPDGRDVDALLHVNPRLKERGFLVVHNPLDEPVTRTLRVPLYYTGLTGDALVRDEQGVIARRALDRAFAIEVPVSVPPRSLRWFVIE
jgi:hypothetical protein